jgi:hypothetical protein
MRQGIISWVVAVASSACGVAAHDAAQEPGEPIGEAGEAEERSVPRIAPSERTGEAKEPATVTECLAQYDFNMRTCNTMPPDAKLGCVLATHVILTHCLRSG